MRAPCNCAPPNCKNVPSAAPDARAARLVAVEEERALAAVKVGVDGQLGALALDLEPGLRREHRLAQLRLEDRRPARAEAQQTRGQRLPGKVRDRVVQHRRHALHLAQPHSQRTARAGQASKSKRKGKQ